MFTSTSNLIKIHTQHTRLVLVWYTYIKKIYIVYTFSIYNDPYWNQSKKLGQILLNEVNFSYIFIGFLRKKGVTSCIYT